MNNTHNMGHMTYKGHLLMDCSRAAARSLAGLLKPSRAKKLYYRTTSTIYFRSVTGSKEEGSQNGVFVPFSFVQVLLS